jgi:hypothetical protein
MADNTMLSCPPSSSVHPITPVRYLPSGKWILSHVVFKKKNPQKFEKEKELSNVQATRTGILKPQTGIGDKRLSQRYLRD